jgi:hypothetical protein
MSRKGAVRDVAREQKRPRKQKAKSHSDGQRRGEERIAGVGMAVRSLSKGCGVSGSSLCRRICWASGGEGIVDLQTAGKLNGATAHRVTLRSGRRFYVRGVQQERVKVQ